MPPDTPSAVSAGNAPPGKNTTDHLRDLAQKYIQFGEGMQIMCWRHDNAAPSLLDDIIQSTDRIYHFCRTNPTTSRDTFLLIARVARCFDVELPHGDIRHTAEVLRDHLNSGLSPHIPVIAIDDAHLLPDESLEFLLLLIPDSPLTRQRLKVVLFGKSELIDRLSQLRINRERKIHCIQIDDKGRPNWLWKRSSDFKTATVGAVTQQSERKLLNAVVILFCLMLVLLSGYFYQTSSSKQVKNVNDMQKEDNQNNIALPEHEESQYPDIAASTELHGSENNTPPTSARMVEVNPETINVMPSTTPEITPSALTSNFSRDSIPDESSVLGRNWILQQPRTNYTLQLMVASTPDALKKVVQDNTLKLPLALSEFRKDGQILYLLLHGSYATKSEAEHVAKQIEEETAIHPWIRNYASLSTMLGEELAAVQLDVKKKETPVKPAIGASWIWSRNPARYTVQVMADNRLAKLSAYVEQEPRQGQFAIARVSRDGKPWYLLLSGEYATAEEAAQAAKRLSRVAAANSPWIRTFASVHDQMVSAHR